VTFVCTSKPLVKTAFQRREGIALRGKARMTTSRKMHLIKQFLSETPSKLVIA
jgi:hypothetical protein